MDLLKFSEQLRKTLRKLSLDDFELFLTVHRTLDTRIENKEITLELNEDILSGCLRVIKDGRMGYVPFTEPNLNLIELGITTALDKAPPAPFSRFATISAGEAPLPAFDPDVAQLIDNPGKVQQLAQDLVRRAYETNRIETIEGTIRVGKESRLLTTKGSTEPAYAERTVFSAFAEVNNKDFDFFANRKLPELELVSELGARVARNLPEKETSPEAEDMKGRTVPVILHPVFLEDMVRRLIAEHLYASTVQEGMSRYRLGEQVMSRLITLWDDATFPYGESTFVVDDEGTRTRKNLIIEQGILKMFLYDRTTALRDKVESTGNGRRRPVLIEDEHEAPVRCTINDIFIAPGTTALSDMIKGVEKGVFIKILLGFHTANRTTGDFANTLYFGRIIKNGELASLPEPGRWSIKGNALSALKAVSAVSVETIGVGSGVLPYLKTELTVG
ncbi:MAG: TldD/PmbA family protein [candidate division WOR-3 bacterium]